MKIFKNSFLAGLIALVAITAISAEPTKEYSVKISKDLPYVDIDIMGVPVRVDRIQDTKHRLKNSYTKTSRPCPPFCVQPFEPIEGIETYGEIEMLEFLKKEVSNNSGVLIDARLPKWYKEGTIPGAINLPFSILNPKTSKEYIAEVLPLLGAEKKGDVWDFSSAQKLVIFDNGPWCQQGVRAMEHLLELGYPKEKIKYYRGGMQYWQILGFKVLNSSEQ